MSTPFDRLVAAAGPGGDLFSEPCQCDGNVGRCGGQCKVCRSGECCGGMGTIWNPQHPIAEALWERCQCSHSQISGWCDVHSAQITPAFKYAGHHQECAGFIPRFRAEAALKLLDIPAEIRIERWADRVLAWVRMTKLSRDYSGEGPTALDALAAALLAWKDAQKEVKA